MTKDDLRGILTSAYNRERWTATLRAIFPGVRLTAESRDILEERHREKATAAYELGQFTTADERVIGIFQVNLKTAGVQIQHNRVGLRDILRSQWLYDVDGALIAFVQGDKWRFSYVSETRVVSEEGTIETERTEPKRYTYLLGEGEVARTAADRFYSLAGKPIFLKDLREAFSVEKLNDEFFRAYYEQYRRFVLYLAAEENGYRDIFLDTTTEDKEKQEKPIRDFIKLLLGRIVFLHFLQKKGWMGCPASREDWCEGVPHFMQALWESYPDKAHFHSRALRVLFFETLNRNREDDDDLFDIPVALKPGGEAQPVRVPYLNGGLFDADKSAENDIDFPAEYFDGLFRFFAQYNFTVDENDPFEAEVGIDPEMLGHIFENLLEENRNKGVYYTPKEIVYYMCGQTLLRYLRAHLPECAADDAPETRQLEDFVRSYHLPARQDRPDNFIARAASRIEALLDTVTVCDPAIGSGAFPMGMLQHIFNLRLALDLTLDRSKTKRRIIRHNLYGVDIDPGAVDIARLRFWLALVVDEDKPEPLPNLDYKIMQGNSLLESFEGIDLSNVHTAVPGTTLVEPQRDIFGNVVDTQLKFTDVTVLRDADLPALTARFYDETDPAHKAALKREVEEAVDAHLDWNVEKRAAYIDIRLAEAGGVAPSSLTAAKRRELATLEADKLRYEGMKTQLRAMQDRAERPYFLWHLFFGDAFKRGGFDIIIGNPPYLRIQGIQREDPRMADALRAEYGAATGAFDLYVLFAERGLQMLKPAGVLAYIMPVKWTNAAFGIGLRRVVSEGGWASRIISFEAYQVFNVSTYTGLQWFQQRGSGALEYYGLDRDIRDNDELGELLAGLGPERFHPIDHTRLGEGPWTLTHGETAKLLDKMRQQPRAVSDIFRKIYQGIATSKDSVYFLADCKDARTDTVIGYSKELDRKVEIEAGLLRPLLKGDQVHRYEPLRTRNRVVFPYRLDEGRAVLLTEAELRGEYPMGYRYLKENEVVLREREDGRFNGERWFQFGRNQGTGNGGVAKLMAPDISLGGNYAFDDEGIYYSTTTVYGYVKHEEEELSYAYLMALLNSQVCWFFLKNTGAVLANGYFRYKPDYINPFPVAEGSADQQMQLEHLVEKVLRLKRDRKDATRWEAKIDALVFHLYGFDKSEVTAVLESLTELGLAERTAIQNEYRNVAQNKFNLEV